MSTPKPLSPAVQAVMDAANGATRWSPDDCLNDARFIAAAVLRAVVEQVVPEPHCPIPPNLRPFVLGLEQRLATRAEMLAIATKLEGADG
jgi:hypothetical protein